MLTLECVAHCWRYSKILSYFLSAIALHPPRACKLIATICHAPAADDPKTAETLAYFGAMPVPSVTWNWLELPVPMLCRRAIGRNIACHRSTADYVLMGDVDYIFGAGSLDAAAVAMPAACFNGPKLMYPKIVNVSRSHEDGDAEIAAVDCPQLIEVAPERYIRSSLNRAIGGSQYFPGDFARERGYLSNSRLFQQTADRWVRTKCDVAFRRWAGLQSAPIEMPGVYRIRHSKRGRTDIGVEL
jgi:hypothetical protein